jgi:hypothetical protein
MSLVERAQAIRDRLRNPPNAVVDDGIDLKRKPKERPAIALRFGAIKPYISKRTHPAPEDLTRVVCEHYGVSTDDLQGGQRTYVMVRPRQMWAFLGKRELALSFPKIGHYLGGRDSSTQVHAVQKITDLVETDAKVCAEAELLKVQLNRLFCIRNSVRCFDPKEI